MGSVVFHDDAEPRIRALAAKMGWDIRLAAGCLKYLWGDSQDVGVSEATAEEIIFWCREVDPAVGQKLIDVLQDRSVRFLSKKSDNLFEIRGNKAELEKSERVSDQRRQASLRRWHPDYGLFGPPDSETQSGPHSNSDVQPKKKKKPQQPVPAKALSDDTPSPEKLAEVWNLHKSAAQARVDIKAFTPSQARWQYALDRLKEIPDLAYWASVVQTVAASDWCNGKNERGWKADFTFLVRPETHVKAADGKYGNDKKPSQTTMKIFKDEDFA